MFKKHLSKSNPFYTIGRMKLSSEDSRPMVYVTRKVLPEPAMKILKANFDLRFWPGEDATPKSVLLKEVKDVDGLYCLLTEKIDEEIIAAGENLKAICQVAVGYDNINVVAATKRGIYVTNTPGVLTETTADMAFALLMATARRVAEADRYVRQGKWKIPWGLMMILGQNIWGKTVGIIGMGRIGSAMAKRAIGFNMKVLYYKPKPNENLEKELCVKYVNFENLLKQSDFVTLHVPLLPQTHHLIGERELKMMKKTACLINTSRGSVVDEKALYKALKEGWIWAAGLDVWEKEPTDPDNPLLTLDNVTVAPHIASGSIETRTKMAVMAAENLVSILRGKIPPNLVNKNVLKVRPLSES